MATAALAAPPTAPGTLTSPPAAKAVLAYLSQLDRWVGDLRDALDNLDARAQVAHDPGAYTQDIVLAMSLWRSIDARRQELETAWDSGRVLADGLAHIATLIWGRLTDSLGAPAAFTLPEACTLAAALQDRLTATLATDAVAGSGVAARIDPLRAAIARCRQQAGVLGIATTRIDELGAELERAIAGSDAAVIAEAVERIDREIALTERDLIKEAGSRASISNQVSELQRRYAELVTKTAEVGALAARCIDKIANPPRLAVPSITVLGQPPAPVPGRDLAQREAAREQLATYTAKLGRYAAAISVAHDRFAAPLQEREDLRGLLGAYQNRAQSNGLAEDAALGDQYRAAHEVLWSAPCDLAVARTLVTAYQHAVRIAVGAEPAVEPQAHADAPSRELS